MMDRVFDAARPPMTAPPGMSGVLGYIGGAAEHVWTLEEWLRFTGLRQFPTWVCAVGGQVVEPDPRQAGMAAVKAARSLGWAPDEPEPGNRAIVLDMEAAVNPAFYAEIAATVTAGGFTPVCYGSSGTVLGNAASDILVAHFGVLPSIPPGQAFHGLQYDADVPFEGTQVDYSVFDAWLMARGGVGPRHG